MQEITWAAFRLLLSRPLTHLDMSGLEVAIPDEEKDSVVRGGSWNNITTAWKVLLLPRIITGSGAITDRVMNKLLGPYVDGGAHKSKTELEYIPIQPQCLGNIRDGLKDKYEDDAACLGGLRSLRSIEIRANINSLDLSPLCRLNHNTLPITSRLSTSSASARSVAHSPPSLPQLLHLSISNARRSEERRVEDFVNTVCILISTCSAATPPLSYA